MYRPTTHYLLGVTVEGSMSCQHTDYTVEIGPSVGSNVANRKRTVTCKSCGRVEVQRPYASKVKSWR